MFMKRNIFIVLAALLAAALIAGCGLAMKDSGGDQTGAALRSFSLGGFEATA